MEHLESLVKLATQKKDLETMDNQVSMVSTSPTIKKICINNTHHNKTLHLLVEINNYVVKGLVDIGASMSIMVVVVIKDLGIMHLVTRSKTYKIMSRVVITQTMGRIN